MIQSHSLKYKLSRFICKSIIQTFERLSRQYKDYSLPLFDKELKENFEVIKNEFINYKNTIPSAGYISKEQLKIENENKWKTLVLKVFGYYNQDSCKKCPQTYRIISSHKNVASVLFSVMEPGSHIKPHRGAFNGVLRYHLGIIVPSSKNIYINIDNQKKYWKEKESFVFDDTYIHEAVNQSNEQRVVLIIDYIRPLPFTLNVINKCILKLISKSPLIQNIIENIENLNKQNENI